VLLKLRNEKWILNNYYSEHDRASGWSRFDASHPIDQESAPPRTSGERLPHADAGCPGSIEPEVHPRVRPDRGGRAGATSAEIAARWNKFSYADLSAPGFEQRFFGITNWANLSLSPIQQARLRTRVLETLSYLREPTLQRYLQTNGLTTHFQLSLGARQLLNWYPVTNAVDPSPSVDQIVTKIWDAISERNKGQPSAGLRAINFDHEKVGVSHTNTADSTFLGTTAQGVSIACEAVDAGYQYGTENDSPTSSDAGLFVIMSFLAHSNSASNAAPMYRLTWRR